MAVPTLVASYNWYPGDNYDAITSVQIVNSYSENLLPSGVTVAQSWPVDVDETGAIICYELSNSTLILAGNGSGKIMANEDCSEMFFGMTDLESIIGLELIDTSSVTTMFRMFMRCPVVNCDLSKFDTKNVTNMTQMFASVRYRTSFDLSSFDTSRVTDMDSMFSGCQELETIYVSKLWNTEAVTDSSDMFKNCAKLVGGNGTAYDSTIVDGSRACVDTAEAAGYFTYKAFGIAFAVYCADDTSLTFYKRETVPAVGDTFEGKAVTAVYEGIETDDYASGVPWSSFASQVTKAVVADQICPISLMMWFGQMSALQTVDLSKLDTSMVTSMRATFAQCTSLKSLDLRGFDTSNVTDMWMMFTGCTMPTLDLSSFDTSKVTLMTSMFMMTSIVTILVSERWNADSAASSYNVFTYSSYLVGGNGTKCDGNTNTGPTYARIDTPETPGYFTYKKYYPVWGDHIIQGETLYDIADAIREKTGSTDSLTPSQMAEAILGIGTS